MVAALNSKLHSEVVHWELHALELEGCQWEGSSIKVVDSPVYQVVHSSHLYVWDCFVGVEEV